MAKTEEAVKREPRRIVRSLVAIGEGITTRHDVSVEELRSGCKAREIMQARRVFSQTAKAYGLPTALNFSCCNFHLNEEFAPQTVQTTCNLWTSVLFKILSSNTR